MKCLIQFCSHLAMEGVLTRHTHLGLAVGNSDLVILEFVPRICGQSQFSTLLLCDHINHLGSLKYKFEKRNTVTKTPQ